MNDIEESKVPENKGGYGNCIDLTQQFRFCGNPFRVDLYKGCTFGCKYCFANSNQTLYHNDGFDMCNIEDIKKYFSKAFDSDEPTSHRIVECLRHKVPLHCGGMSDPFQPAEFKYRRTYELIELSKKYNYPIVFSTKTASLPDEYFEILDPKLHAFQISIMGWTNDFITKYESNTPSAEDRVHFLQKLRERGFWCAVRIQPLVDIGEAVLLIHALKYMPNYITVEHLKIPVDNEQVKNLFKDEYSLQKFYRSSNNLRNIEVSKDIKISNIKRIQEVANMYGVRVGVGDNDLHHLSQSRCCCGIDIIGGEFNNWLRYNTTYMITGDCKSEEMWCPKSNLASCFYSGTRLASFVKFEDATNKYISDNPELIPDEYQEQVSNLTGVKFNYKLF